MCLSYFKQVTEVISKKQVPLEPEVVKCLLALFSPEDLELASRILEFFTQKLNETPMENKKETPIVMNATCCMEQVSVFAQPDISFLVCLDHGRQVHEAAHLQELSRCFLFYIYAHWNCERNRS